MSARMMALALIGSAALGGEPGFTVKPTATRVGEKTKITFAVSAPTDVAVFVEDAKGEVVRHLVAGVLGDNPPPPLKPGLAQEVEWDGKADYGKPLPSVASGGGEFKVRVALGLRAKYDRVVSSKPQNLSRIPALGTGPDGTLYVRNWSNPAVWAHTQILAFGRDGSYLRTLLPFPSSLTMEQAKPWGVMELDGRPAPADYRWERDTVDVLSSDHGPNSSTIAVSHDGRELYMLLGRVKPYGEPGIVRLGVDGSCPAAPFCAPLKAGGKLGVSGRGMVCLSRDGKNLFLAGLTADPGGKKPTSAVYCVAVPERKDMSVFFGDPDKAGNGQDLLGGAPVGLATDGKGNLLIADAANNRVVVVGEKDGKYVGELPVEGASGLGVSQKTGAVYVTAVGKGGVQLLRFDSLQATKASAELQVYRGDPRSVMTVDPVSDPPVVWFGGWKGLLLRVEDKGGKLEAVTVGPDSDRGTQEGYLGLVVDRLRKEIYVRNGGNGDLWHRFVEKTGQLEDVRIPDGRGGGGHGLQLTPAPDGNLYGLKWTYTFFKWDRNGKPLAWEKPKRPGPEDMFDPTKEMKFHPRLADHIGVVPVAMCELPHELGMRWSDGHFLIQEAGVCVPGGGPKNMKALHEYGLDGQRITKMDAPIIWKMSDCAVGPKLDAAGNIYLAETVRPKGWMYPEELKAALDAAAPGGRAASDKVLASMYGSIVKFGPQGGMFHYPVSTSMPDPFRGQPKLDGLKSAEYDYFRNRLQPIKVTGAEWVRPGIGHVGFYSCNCENVTFDVDEFGRVFFPDLALYRVRVIDTAGNAITHFGGYGNPENMGPESPVLDEKTGRLRPPKPGEKSPLAQPDIAFAWLVGVGVTDRYAYMGDAMNRRLLRAKLVYAAEETCEVK